MRVNQKFLRVRPLVLNLAGFLRGFLCLAYKKGARVFKNHYLKALHQVHPFQYCHFTKMFLLECVDEEDFGCNFLLYAIIITHSLPLPSFYRRCA